MKLSDIELGKTDLTLLSSDELLKLLDEAENEYAANDAAQNAVKVNLNSAYGTFSSAYFMWFNVAIGEAITLSGQLCNQAAYFAVNSFLQKQMKTETDYILGGDTDSFFVCLGDLVDKYMPKFSTPQITDALDKFAKEKITPIIDAATTQILKQTHAYRHAVKYKRETIWDRMLITKKKRYGLRVLDKEGIRYKEPKLKIVGIEVVRSSTPRIAQPALKRMIELVFNGDESAVHKECSAFRETWMKAPYNDIARVTGVSDISGTTMQAKAAVTFNRLIRDKGLEAKYRKINNNDKIKMLHLQMPNPTRNAVIGFVAELPKEFDLDKFVDREMQFEKAFLGPLEPILNSVGWTAFKVETLDSLFD